MLSDQDLKTGVGALSVRIIHSDREQDSFPPDPADVSMVQSYFIVTCTISKHEMLCFAYNPVKSNSRSHLHSTQESPGFCRRQSCKKFIELNLSFKGLSHLGDCHCLSRSSKNRQLDPLPPHHDNAYDKLRQPMTTQATTKVNLRQATTLSVTTVDNSVAG